MTHPPPPAVPLFAWLLPLFCSLVYVCGAMFVKYSARFRVNLWQSSWYANLAVCGFSSPLWLVPGPPLPWDKWWQPCLAGAAFWLGQFTTLVALDQGDVSIATPVLGLKILFVLLFSMALSETTHSGYLWLAAGLSILAIVLLQAGQHAAHRRLGLTIVLSGISAMSYAMFDVLIVSWSPDWGKERLLPLAFLVVLVVSTVVAYARVGTLRLPPAARPALLWGTGLIGLQSVTLIYAIAWTQDAPRVNLIYNSRGCWSVLAVWLVGNWFDNHERHLSRAILLRRFFGAVLMLAAIFLAIS